MISNNYLTQVYFLHYKQIFEIVGNQDPTSLNHTNITVSHLANEFVSSPTNKVYRLVFESSARFVGLSEYNYPTNPTVDKESTC